MPKVSTPVVPPLPKPGDLLKGKYHLEKILGAGGMGTVFLAEDTSLHRYAAIKCLHLPGVSPERLARSLLREARAAASIQHPNVVHVIEVDVTEAGIPFLVMELVAGKTLRFLSQHLSPMDAISAISYALQTARALAAAHKKGVIHCDLKPDNILVTEEAQVKVSDFGLARHIERGHFGTTDGAVEGRGTPHYMAPELFRGIAPSAASDIYALGCTLFEILTAIPLVCRDSIEVLSVDEVKERHLYAEPLSLEHFGGPLLAPLGVLLSSMIAKNPRERPSALQVIEGLRFEHFRLRRDDRDAEERWPGELDGERPSRAMMRALQGSEEEVPAVSDRMRAYLTEELPPSFKPASPLPAGFEQGRTRSGTLKMGPAPAPPVPQGHGATAPIPGAARAAPAGAPAPPHRRVTTERMAPVPAPARPHDVTAPLVPAPPPRLTSDAVTMTPPQRPTPATPAERAPRSGRGATIAIAAAVGVVSLSLGLAGRELIASLRGAERPAPSAGPTTPPSDATSSSAAASAPVPPAKGAATATSAATGEPSPTATTPPSDDAGAAATTQAPPPASSPKSPPRPSADPLKPTDPWAPKPGTKPRPGGAAASAKPAATAAPSGTAAPPPRTPLPFGKDEE